MAKLIDLNGLAHVYSIIKGMLAEKLGKNDTAVNASKVNNLTVETAVPKNAKFTDTVYEHPSTHPASMITGLAAVAKSGSYNDLADKPTIPASATVDSELSSTSVNPVQNKVIKEALDGKLGKNDTAAAAIKDGAGNIIANTYAKKADINGVVKSVNGVQPDTSGNVSITVGGGGGVSTSEVNTWTAEQIFNDVTISGLEKSEPVMLNGNSITPTSSCTIWRATVDSSNSLCTLNLDGLIAKTSKISRFEILLNAMSSTLPALAPTLKITSTNNTDIVCPENTQCNPLFNVIHGIIVKLDPGDPGLVFIKIDNFTEDWRNISS